MTHFDQLGIAIAFKKAKKINNLAKYKTKPPSTTILSDSSSRYP